jgi:S-adenosyl methyltransferase
MPSGSYLAISSLRLPGLDLPEQRAITIRGEALLVGTLGSGRWREDSDILSWFGDWEMIEPGLVSLLDWRSDEPDRVPFPEIQNSFFGGVARKK